MFVTALGCAMLTNMQPIPTPHRDDSEGEAKVAAPEPRTFSASVDGCADDEIEFPHGAGRDALWADTLEPQSPSSASRRGWLSRLFG
jgi:hypothetical protein